MQWSSNLTRGTLGIKSRSNVQKVGIDLEDGARNLSIPMLWTWQSKNKKDPRDVFLRLIDSLKIAQG